MTDESSIQVCSASVNLSGRRLINEATFEIHPGEITVMIGANGAGKTTLLRAVSAEIKISSGKIMINGRSSSDLSKKHLSRVRAVLPQHSKLDFPFKVREVVSIGRSPHDPQRHDDMVIDEVLAFCDVTALAHRRYTDLSGGEQQRVQLARVLIQVWEDENNMARYLLLDEPVASLDLTHQYRLFERLRAQVRQRRLGVLAVLHDINLAARFADQVIILAKGRVRDAGTVDEVLNEHNIKAIYDIGVSRLQHPLRDKVSIFIPQ